MLKPVFLNLKILIFFHFLSAQTLQAKELIHENCILTASDYALKTQEISNLLVSKGYYYIWQLKQASLSSQLVLNVDSVTEDDQDKLINISLFNKVNTMKIEADFYVNSFQFKLSSNLSEEDSLNQLISELAIIPTCKVQDFETKYPPFLLRP